MPLPLPLPPWTGDQESARRARAEFESYLQSHLPSYLQLTYARHVHRTASHRKHPPPPTVQIHYIPLAPVLAPYSYIPNIVAPPPTSRLGTSPPFFPHPKKIHPLPSTPLHSFPVPPSPLPGPSQRPPLPFSTATLLLRLLRPVAKPAQSLGMCGFGIFAGLVGLGLVGITWLKVNAVGKFALSTKIPHK